MAANNIVEMLRTPTGCVPPSLWELAAAHEIERLRKALQKIADLPPPEHLRRPYKRSPQRIAISALKHGSKPPSLSGREK